jgi:GNAT superfamily N-acetyltransferase
MTTETPLVNASTAQLTAAVQENVYALFRAMATLPSSELVEGGKLSYHLAFPSNPMYKGVWRTRLAAEEVDNVIDQTIAWFKDRQAPFFLWWTGPDTMPDDLGLRLMTHGLLSLDTQPEGRAPGTKFSEMGSPGMVADLRQMNQAERTQVPAGLTIEAVQDEIALDAFKQVIIEGHAIPEGMAHGWVQAALTFGIGHTPWQMYVGKLNGKPVATQILFKGAGVAGVYAVTTVPTARGKGIGTAITLQPLLKAYEQGYRYAVLLSTEMALRIYKRIGFRDCGIRMNRYLWINRSLWRKR